MSEQQFFETVTKSYQDVPITEAGVDTAAFCEASDNLVRIFDLFGNPAFGIVKSDIAGNINKVRTYHLTNPEATSTLEKLLAQDKIEHPQSKKGQLPTASEGLLWLLRGLKFTSNGLAENLKNPKEELSASFRKSYETSLKAHHGFLVRPVFSAAMSACPYRKDFYPKLGTPTEVVQPKLEEWLAALQKIVAKEEDHFVSGGYGKV